MGLFDIFRKKSSVSDAEDKAPVADSEGRASEAMGCGEGTDAEAASEGESAVMGCGEGTDAEAASEGESPAMGRGEGTDAEAASEGESAVMGRGAGADAGSAPEGEGAAQVGEYPSESRPLQEAPQRKPAPEEIAARREAIRKQQEEQETKGKLLSYMIDQYHEQRTPKALEAAIRCLGDTLVVVPMKMLLDKAEAEAVDKARQAGRQYKPAKPLNLAPALFKNTEGSLHYPVYASRADIPKGQLRKFVWITMPAPRCAADVVRNEKVEALVVNPFGKSLVLRRELLEKIVQVKSVETPTLESGGRYTL